MIKSKTTRRDVLSLGVSTALFPIVAISQENTSWPSQPVHIIVPFAPGGAIDAISRIMSEGLRTEFDKPFVIEIKRAQQEISVQNSWQKADPMATPFWSGLLPHTAPIQNYSKI